MWLRSTREENDPDAYKFAVFGKRIQDDGWVVYMALHDGKKKSDQLGWLGKQWGVWNREKFVDRPPLSSVSLPAGMDKVYRRFLRRWLWSKRRTAAETHLEQAERSKTTEDRQRHLDAWKSLSKKPRALHGGNLLRCCNGSEFARLALAMRDGVVSHISVAAQASAARPFAGPGWHVISAGVCTVGGVVVAHVPEQRWSKLP
jgi:hypothetical protein